MNRSHHQNRHQSYCVDRAPPPSTDKDAVSSTRVVLETTPMVSTLQDHLRPCPKCKRKLQVSFGSVGIASYVRITCKKCDYKVEQPRNTTNIELPLTAGSPFIERNSWYATNVLYFLSFLTKGDGGSEAGHFAGLLGLPKATTMETGTFKAVEKDLGPHLHHLAEEVLLANLKAEVKTYYMNKYDEDEGLELYNRWLRKELPRNQWPHVRCSADMGWQKRSSGRRYDSHSGHAFLVAMALRKPIAWYVCSKVCAFCKSHYTRHGIDQPVAVHTCVKNHDGSSGSMEPLAVLEMYKHLYTKHCVIVETIITDDDSSIKAKMKWTNNDHRLNHIAKFGVDPGIPKIINRNGNIVDRPDHGRVPRHMPEPKFEADPNHRKKTLKGELYRLAGARKKDRLTMSKIDCIRISTNFAYFVRQLPSRAKDLWLIESKAILDHHFDKHLHCGKWCPVINNSTNKTTTTTTTTTDGVKKATRKFYRDMEKDKGLYVELEQRLARFITLDALEEVGHGDDTQVNESLNNSVAWVAPKNKYYSSSLSLKNRIAVVTCINGLGTLEFYKRLFDRLGMTMPDDTLNYLQWQDRKRTKRIRNSKTPEAKKKRQKNFHQKMLEHTEDAKKEQAKREGGFYQPGIGMDGGYITAQAPKKPKTKNICPLPLCRRKGHKTKRSKSCKYNPNCPDYIGLEKASAALKSDDTEGEPMIVPTEEAAAQINRDVQEQDIMDQLPLDDEFFSAEEFSSDNTSFVDHDSIDDTASDVAEGDYGII